MSSHYNITIDELSTCGEWTKIESNNTFSNMSVSYTSYSASSSYKCANPDLVGLDLNDTIIEITPST